MSDSLHGVMVLANLLLPIFEKSYYSAFDPNGPKSVRGIFLIFSMKSLQHEALKFDQIIFFEKI